MEVTVAQMKQIEKNADARGLSYLQMMENAGCAAARFLLQKAEAPIRTAVVFCGNGNNGGDGFVVARKLTEAGAAVRVVLTEGQPKTPDAIENCSRAKKMGIVLWLIDEINRDQSEWIAAADAVVDAMYGTGFHGELRPAGKKAAEQINAAKGFKLALDLPSGTEADTGRVADGAVRADLTVTFHASKACHRLCPEQCGKVEIASIGVEKLDG